MVSLYALFSAFSSACSLGMSRLAFLLCILSRTLYILWLRSRSFFFLIWRLRSAIIVYYAFVVIISYLLSLTKKEKVELLPHVSGRARSSVALRALAVVAHRSGHVA